MQKAQNEATAPSLPDKLTAAVQSVESDAEPVAVPEREVQKFSPAEDVANACRQAIQEEILASEKRLEKTPMELRFGLYQELERKALSKVRIRVMLDTPRGTPLYINDTTEIPAAEWTEVDGNLLAVIRSQAKQQRCTLIFRKG